MRWKGEAIWSAMTQSYSAMRQKVLFWEKLDYIWHQRHCVSKQPWESNRQVECLAWEFGRSHRLPWANPVLPWEAANAAMRPQLGVGWGGFGGTGWNSHENPQIGIYTQGYKNCPKLTLEKYVKETCSWSSNCGQDCICRWQRFMTIISCGIEL